MRPHVLSVAEKCPIEVAMTVLGGKWKLSIMKYLLEGTKRFSELQRLETQLTPRMLTRQLRELEADGLVHRHVYPKVPPRIEYSATATGTSLREIVGILWDWGNWYRDQHLLDPTADDGPEIPRPT